MVFYGVVSADTKRVVQFFQTREEAEALIAGVLEEAPELRGLLDVAPVEFPVGRN